MAFKEVQSKASKYSDCETWNDKGKLTAGDSIEGYFIDKEQFNTKFGEMIIIIIETEAGIFRVKGQTDIKNKFAEIELGTKVRITFEGIKETDRGAKKSYIVEADDEDMKDIQNA